MTETLVQKVGWYSSPAILTNLSGIPFYEGVRDERVA